MVSSARAKKEYLVEHPQADRIPGFNITYQYNSINQLLDPNLSELPEVFKDPALRARLQLMMSLIFSLQGINPKNYFQISNELAIGPALDGTPRILLHIIHDLDKAGLSYNNLNDWKQARPRTKAQKIFDKLIEPINKLLQGSTPFIRYRDLQ